MTERISHPYGNASPFSLKRQATAAFVLKKKDLNRRRFREVNTRSLDTPLTRFILLMATVNKRCLNGRCNYFVKVIAVITLLSLCSVPLRVRNFLTSTIAASSDPFSSAARSAGTIKFVARLGKENITVNFTRAKRTRFYLTQFVRRGAREDGEFSNCKHEDRVE